MLSTSVSKPGHLRIVKTTKNKQKIKTQKSGCVALVKWPAFEDFGSLESDALDFQHPQDRPVMLDDFTVPNP